MFASRPRTVSPAQVDAASCEFLENKECGVHASRATARLQNCVARGNYLNATFETHGGAVATETCDLDARARPTQAPAPTRGGKCAFMTPRSETR